MSQNLHEIVMAEIARQPEMLDWPVLVELLKRGRSADWHIPMLVAQSLGQPIEPSLPAAVALACLQVSIVLVDDMLDNDPRGGFHEFGTGRTANYALALQAAGVGSITRAPIPTAAKTAALQLYAAMANRTAHGQHLDSENLQGEENYWRVVHTKSTPFYAGAFKLGAIFAGVSADKVEAFANIGHLVGELAQIQDDITDALDPEKTADWDESRNNLLIMFASTADHEEREQLLALKPRIAQPDVLAQAQNILVRSGALSYGVYLLVQKYEEARDLLTSLKLTVPEQIHQWLDIYRQFWEEMLGEDSISLTDSLS